MVYEGQGWDVGYILSVCMLGIVVQQLTLTLDTLEGLFCILATPLLIQFHAKAFSGRQQVVTQDFGLHHLCGKPEWSSSFLVVVWPNPSNWGYLRSEPETGRSPSCPLSLSLCPSLLFANKYKFKTFKKTFYLPCFLFDSYIFIIQKIKNRTSKVFV